MTTLDYHGDFETFWQLLTVLLQDGGGFAYFPESKHGVAITHADRKSYVDLKTETLVFPPPTV